MNFPAFIYEVVKISGSITAAAPRNGVSQWCAVQSSAMIDFLVAEKESVRNIHKHLYSFDVLLTVYLSIFISVVNQLDAQNFCFTISLFHASTCFEHMCLKHVEAWNKLIVKQTFCASSWLITEINIYMQFLQSGAQEHNLQCQNISKHMLWGSTFKVWELGVFN